VAVGARTERVKMNDLFTGKSKDEIAIERLQAFETSGRLWLAPYPLALC
jgi:hypothetical protein